MSIVFKMTFIEPQKIAIIRRNRLGDMICTLPLIHALRGRFPEVEIVVVSDKPGCEIARWVPEINHVFPFKSTFLKFLNPWLNRSAFMGCDLVIAAKGGFDRGLAKVVRRSGALNRIGFDACSPSEYYTHPIPLPHYEHQIKSLFRLLSPLGVAEPAEYCFQVSIPTVNPAFFDWQCGVHKKKLLLSLSCNRGQYWPTSHYLELMDRLQSKGQIQVGVMRRPEERFSKDLEEQLRLKGVVIFEPSNLAVVANLLKSGNGYLSPEGGLVHLAACTGTPTIVLWRPDGVILKWGSTAKSHLDLQPASGIENLSVDEMIDQIERHFGWEIEK